MRTFDRFRQPKEEGQRYPVKFPALSENSFQNETKSVVSYPYELHRLYMPQSMSVCFVFVS